MPKSDNLASISLVLSIAISLIAVTLGIHQWWEHRSRGTGLPAVERKHFLQQDLRRGFGIILLGLLAAGIYVGSRLPTFVTEPVQPAMSPADPVAGAAVPPAPKAHPNRQFLAVWLAVIAIISILLGLALIDWVSTRRYAERQRQMMSRERLEILRETLRAAESARNGQSDDPLSEPL